MDVGPFHLTYLSSLTVYEVDEEEHMGMLCIEGSLRRLVHSCPRLDSYSPEFLFPPPPDKVHRMRKHIILLSLYDTMSQSLEQRLCADHGCTMQTVGWGFRAHWSNAEGGTYHSTQCLLNLQPASTSGKYRRFLVPASLQAIDGSSMDTNQSNNATHNTPVLLPHTRRDYLHFSFPLSTNRTLCMVFGLLTHGHTNNNDNDNNNGNRTVVSHESQPRVLHSSTHQTGIGA